MDPVRREVLRTCVWQRMRNLLVKPEADPLNVFVKQEPHKVKKIRENRFRLISGVSFVDTMIDRILFHGLAAAVKRSVMWTPALIGWAPHSGQHRLLSSMFGRRKVMSIDKEAWDWTLREWMVNGLKNFLKRLCVNMPDWWEKMVDARFEMLFTRAVWRFSDGDEWIQTFTGIMKSGCYLTIILNSAAQVYLHHATLVRMRCERDFGTLFAVGDDTVQDEEEHLLEYVYTLGTLGCWPKKPVVGYRFEFCGFEYYGGEIMPLYRDKHQFNIEHVDPGTRDEVLASYLLMYAFSNKDYQRLASLVSDAGLSRLWSRQRCIRFLDQGTDPF